MFYQIVYFIDCLLVLIILCLYIYLNCFLSHHSPQGPFFSVHQFFFPPSLFFVCGLLSFACISFLFFFVVKQTAHVYTQTYEKALIIDARWRAWEMNEYVRERKLSTSSSSPSPDFFLMVLYDTTNIHEWVILCTSAQCNESISIFYINIYAYLLFVFFSFYGLIAKNNSKLINQATSHSL
jgi:hypothetical protein